MCRYCRRVPVKGLDPLRQRFWLMITYRPTRQLYFTEHTDEYDGRYFASAITRLKSPPFGTRTKRWCPARHPRESP